MPSDSDIPTSHVRTCVDIDLGALRRNARAIRRAVGVKMLFVLKKDAYGHGAAQCAEALEEEGADYFGVASIEEGLALRQAGRRTPILVFAVPCAADADADTMTVADVGGLSSFAHPSGRNASAITTRRRSSPRIFTAVRSRLSVSTLVSLRCFAAPVTRKPRSHRSS